MIYLLLPQKSNQVCCVTPRSSETSGAAGRFSGAAGFPEFVWSALLEFNNLRWVRPKLPGCPGLQRNQGTEGEKGLELELPLLAISELRGG